MSAVTQSKFLLLQAVHRWFASFRCFFFLCGVVRVTTTHCMHDYKIHGRNLHFKQREKKWQEPRGTVHSCFAFWKLSFLRHLEPKREQLVGGLCAFLSLIFWTPICWITSVGRYEKYMRNILPLYCRYVSYTDVKLWAIYFKCLHHSANNSMHEQCVCMYIQYSIHSLQLLEEGKKQHVPKRT